MRKYDKPIMIVLGVVLLAMLFFQTQPTVVQAATEYVNSWLRSNVVASSDGVSLKVEMSPGDAITKDFATTDSVEPILTLGRTSTGTPANGIGGSLDLKVETTAGNEEIGARIAAVTSDVTAASEDIGISFYTMAGGSAAAVKTSVGSTGIWTYAGGATIDNVTSASILNLTETTVAITGNETVSGSVDITGAGGLILSNDETITNAVNGVISVDGTFDITAAGGLVLSNDETITNGTDGRVDIGGDTYLNGAVKFKTCTIADGDATPDVAGCHILTTSSNTAPTAITDLDNPVVGSIYIIVGGSATNSSTIADSGNFALSAAFTATVDETLTLYVQADNDYIELTRSTN